MDDPLQRTTQVWVAPEPPRKKASSERRQPVREKAPRPRTVREMPAKALQELTQAEIYVALEQLQESNPQARRFLEDLHSIMAEMLRLDSIRRI